MKFVKNLYTSLYTYYFRRKYIATFSRHIIIPPESTLPFVVYGESQSTTHINIDVPGTYHIRASVLLGSNNRVSLHVNYVPCYWSTVYSGGFQQQVHLECTIDIEEPSVVGLINLSDADIELGHPSYVVHHTMLLIEPW